MRRAVGVRAAELRGDCTGTRRCAALAPPLRGHAGRLAPVSSHTPPPLPSIAQSLLCDPNLDSPANVEAARLLKSNPKDYKKRVRRLAQKTLEG
jgi:hypothetical protein